MRCPSGTSKGGDPPDRYGGSDHPTLCPRARIADGIPPPDARGRQTPGSRLTTGLIAAWHPAMNASADVGLGDIMAQDGPDPSSMQQNGRLRVFGQAI